MVRVRYYRVIFRVELAVGLSDFWTIDTQSSKSSRPDPVLFRIKLKQYLLL